VTEATHASLKSRSRKQICIVRVSLGPMGIVLVLLDVRFFITVKHLWSSCSGAPSLTRGRVYNLLVQFVVGIACKSHRTRDLILLSRLSCPNLEVEVTLRLTVSQSVSQSVSLGIEPTLGLATRYYFLSESCCLVSVGRPEDPTLSRQ
jgi:hypothetical protein